MVESTEPTVLKTGTTTIGLTTTEGVVLAADRRASLGRSVASKRVRKVEQVHPRAAVTMAGNVGGAQAFNRQLRAEASLYESRRGEELSIDALAQVASQLLRGIPAAPLLGGVDATGPHVFSLDGGGGVIEDPYSASGSGTPYATGVLEQHYRDDLALEEGVAVARRAVASALERDTASGNGITVARITDEGVDISSYGDIAAVPVDDTVGDADDVAEVR